jgi:hypothetical protein
MVNMNGRRVIAGLCLLSALLAGVITVQSATAATKGTTVFTCVSTAASKTFATEHCKQGQGGSAFGHTAVSQATSTHITLSNEKTNDATNGPTTQILKSTVAGTSVELLALELHGTGITENRVDPSGEHYIHGREIVLKDSSVVVAGFPNCEVYNTAGGVSGATGVIESNKLTGTTGGKGDSIVFTAEAGGAIFAFHITGVGCPFAEPPNALKISMFGSFTCKPDGATVICDHNEITGAKSLRWQNPVAGPVAGIAGKFTVTGSGKEEPGGTTKPLSVTTVETA